MEPICKSVLVAEIEKRIADNKKEIERASHKNLEDYFEGYEDALTLFKEWFLNTLEVKEVDLEKEYKEFINCDNGRSMFETAKYFFELGLFSTLTWQDIRRIAEIGNDFMNSEESDNLTEEAYYGAILDKVREKGRDAKTSWSERRETHKAKEK